MEESTRLKVEEILFKVSDALGVKIELKDEEEGKRLSPVFDSQAIVSKFMALMVYCGWNTPVFFAPPYNRVHADVEWWKSQLEKKSDATPETPEQPNGA